MAANFTTMAVLFGTRLVGGTQIVETAELTGLSIPHEVSFTVTVDKVDGWKDALLAAAAAEAAEVESLFGA